MNTSLHPTKLIKTLSAGFLILVCTVALSDSSKAQVAGNDFGLGVMLGEPTGVSVKVWTTSQSAFDVGAAWSLSGSREALHLHADLLWHSWFSDTENVAFYYGIGGRVILTDDAHAGVRVPLGLTYIFDEIPFDLFVEAVPIFDLAPDTEFAGNGAVGIRYYF